MTRIFLLLTALLPGISGLLSGQTGPNLVPNPGFEAHYGLPDGEGHLFKQKGWFNPSGGTEFPFATPDFLHRWGLEKAQLPDSYYGTVEPYDSNAVAGLITYVGWKKDFREYLATPLTAPLEPGKTYRIRLRITNGTSRYYTGGGIAGLGVAFMRKKPQQFYARLIPTEPQVLWENTVFDTVWRQLEGTFTATDSFRYLCIGNFLPDSLTPYTHVLEGIAIGAYYFIDEVELTEVQAPPHTQIPSPVEPVSPVSPVSPAVPQPPVPPAPKVEEGPVTLKKTAAIPARLGDRRVMRPERLRVERDTVDILVYDPRAEDGDSISLAWNGQWLLNAYKVMNKPLKLTVILSPEGNNTLLFYAHNLGNVPPNTAVVAYDAPDGKRHLVEVRNDLKQSGAVTLTRK